jgi:hypothetical protein
MPQRGREKQVPEDQRSRGLDLEHPEGQANEENQEQQARGKQPTPVPPSGGRKDR